MVAGFGSILAATIPSGSLCCPSVSRGHAEGAFLHLTNIAQFSSLFLFQVVVTFADCGGCWKHTVVFKSFLMEWFQSDLFTF